jgi:two-component system cell cycle sensor histidine kinase/response regulator CckA
MAADQPPDRNLALSQLVHDLKNQLSVMLACADDVARAMPPGVADNQIGLLQRCAERASAIAEEFLIAAHPRFEGRRTVDLNLAVRSAQATLARVTDASIQLELRLSHEPLPVAAELIELERILLNLALNARDAMPDGGVLTVETERIAPPMPQGTASLSPGKARLTVRDTGRGMPADVKGRMFEPLFTTKPRGTGLGLNSVAFTVRQLQGMISVESSVNIGTTVTIVLPLSPNR